MALVLAVIVLVVVANCCYMIYLIADVTAHYACAECEPGKIAGLGFFPFSSFCCPPSGFRILPSGQRRIPN